MNLCSNVTPSTSAIIIISSTLTVPRCNFLLKFCGDWPIFRASSEILIFIFSHSSRIISDVVIFTSSRLCLDFSLPFISNFFAMRGSSLKSPSQNRTCPIKAYGSSISHLPNKHFSNIFSGSPMDVSLGYSYIFSTSANRSGLCVSCSSITPGGHICNTSAILYNSHRFHSTCNALSVLHLTL